MVSITPHPPPPSQPPGLCRHGSSSLEHDTWKAHIRPPVLTQCPWYDTVPEAEALLRVLVSGPEAPDGELWGDLDQGWQIRIVKRDDLVCVAEWDWEERCQPAGGLAFTPMQLSQEATAALARLRAVHRVLVEALGHDWWS